jgi:hypothetical protein
MKEKKLSGFNSFLLEHLFSPRKTQWEKAT